MARRAECTTTRTYRSVSEPLIPVEDVGAQSFGWCSLAVVCGALEIGLVRGRTAGRRHRRGRGDGDRHRPASLTERLGYGWHSRLCEGRAPSCFSPVDRLTARNCGLHARGHHLLRLCKRHQKPKTCANEASKAPSRSFSSGFAFLVEHSTLSKPRSQQLERSQNHWNFEIETMG